MTKIYLKPPPPKAPTTAIPPQPRYPITFCNF